MSQLNQTTPENKSPSEEFIQQKNNESPEITLNRANEERSIMTSQLTSEPPETRSSDEEISSDSADVFDGLSEVGSDEDDPETADFCSEPVSEGPSDITSDQSAKDSLNVMSQEQCVNELRLWVETEAQFYGRTDDEFLIIFLLGCKMDMEKARNKMTKYYQNRKKLPSCLTNRNVNDYEDLLQKRMCILLADSDPHLPTVFFSIYRRYGNEPRAIDRIIALHLTSLDIALRRNNCQQNGLHGVIDCLDYPLWLVAKLLNPVLGYNVSLCLLTAPLRIKGMHFINFPLIGRGVWQVVKPLWPKKIRNRFTFSGSDLTPMREKVDPRLLPIEYGGTNGSLVDHEEAFIEEFHSFSDYFLDDNKYGFDKK